LVGSDRGAPGRASRLSFWLLAATGLAVPLYAFPPLLLAGRPVDLAVLFAAAFLLLNLPALLRSLWEDRARALFAAAAAMVPLLALIPPRDSTFSLAHFVMSLVH
jgi:type IV secretory pathway TraG/TraD family ATPase VirD4